MNCMYNVGKPRKDTIWGYTTIYGDFGDGLGKWVYHTSVCNSIKGGAEPTSSWCAYCCSG